MLARPPKSTASSDELLSCTRLARWRSFELTDTFPPAMAQPEAGLSPQVQEQLAALQLGSRTLIWLEGCDVRAARGAVKLAEKLGCTVHVGESNGSRSLKSVMASEGWLGTTLSEVSARTELVLTLGDGIIREAPLIAARFFRSVTRTSQPYWLHLSPTRIVAAIRGNVATPNEIVHVPRADWFNWLTELAMCLQADRAAPDSAPTVGLTGESVKLVANRLRATEHSVWLWDNDELHEGTDELIIRRLLTLARQLSETRRCALLPLDSNVGRVTADETLLWLTGCSNTASYVAGQWLTQPRYSGYTLADWEASFDAIILVSNLPTMKSLPNLRADLLMQTQSLNEPYALQVAAVGVTDSGHLFRGDRGTVHYFPALQRGVAPTAASVLSHLATTAQAKTMEVGSATRT